MSLKVSDLSKSMLLAFKGSLEESWPEIKDYAKAETKKLAQSIVDIEKMHLAGTIDKDTAKALLDINKNSTKMVLLTVEGIGIIAVEKAINSALKVLKDSVNSALGFVLI
jgi:hypothetical protein